MRRWIPFSLLIALVLVAARPLFASPFFFSDDGLLHLFRVFALDQTLRQGVIYPRWLWDLAYGYGYPIFNYYPPLAAYITETLHMLGLSFAAAAQGAFVVFLAIAIGGAYAMGVDLFAEEKNAQFIGILTATAYVFVPYFFIDVYVRGAMAEALSAAVLPWLIWSWRRALARRAISGPVFAALFLGILLLAHSLTLFIAAPFLGAFLLWEWLHLPRAIKLPAFARLAWSTALGAGLGAIYWLPFVAEVSLVRMSRSNVLVGEIFQANFLEPAKLIQSAWLYQYGKAPFALGLVPVFFGVLAVGAVLAAGKTLCVRGTILFFSMCALVGAAAMIEPLRPAWLAVPFSTMVQHPWRLAIVIGFGLAIAISALPVVIANALPKKIALPVQLAAIAVMGVAIVYSALADFVPQELHFPDDQMTIAQLARFEGYTGFVGTDTWSEYLPVTLRVPSLTSYSAAEKAESRSASADIRLMCYDAMRREIAVSASTAVSISLRAFYFPDWRVTIDDQPVPTYASTPMQLLTVDVPAGDHRVTFVSGDTLSRQVGTAFSIVSAMTLIGLMVFALRRREADARGILVAVMIVSAFIALPTSVALAAQPAALQTTHVSVSSALELIGLRVQDASLQSDVWRVADVPPVLHLRVYWQVKEPLQEKPVAWRLVDDSGKVWTTREQLPRYGTGYAASWVVNEIVEDMYDLPIAAIAPGRFRLQVGYGDAREFVAISAIEFARGFASSSAAPRITYPVNARVGQKIHLLGYDAPQKLIPGARLPLTLFWQTDKNVYDDYTAFIQLLDAEGNAVLKYDSVPGGGLNSPFLWIPSEPVVDRVVLNLPNDLKAGKYTVIVGMYHYPELERLPVTSQTGEPSPDDVIDLGQFEIGNRE